MQQHSAFAAVALAKRNALKVCHSKVCHSCIAAHGATRLRNFPGIPGMNTSMKEKQFMLKE